MAGYSSLRFWFDKVRKELISEYVESEANKIAQILFEDLLSISKSTIATSPDLELGFPQIQQIEEALKRLLQNEPIQYVTGISEFAGRQFQVNKHVLIPRPETEELLVWILDDCKASSQNLNCIDIGTGSGIIPITLKIERPSWEMSAIDISEEALEVAKANAIKHHTDIYFIKDDILFPKKEYNAYDIIISNPPYVTDADKALMQKNVLDFEPHTALFVTDGDSLQFYKAIIKFAQKHLKNSGIIYCEIHEDYAEQTKGLYEKYYSHVELKKDIHGKCRMIKAFKPSKNDIVEERINPNGT